MDKSKTILNELKNCSTKQKKRKLLWELLKNWKIKQFYKLLKCSDEEVEQIYNDLYNHFFEDLVTPLDNE